MNQSRTSSFLDPGRGAAEYITHADRVHHDHAIQRGPTGLVADKETTAFDATMQEAPTLYEDTIKALPYHAADDNHVGFVQISVGIAGPLRVQSLDLAPEDYYARLAIVDSVLVAYCSRICEAFSQCGGLRFRVLREGISTAPVFFFDGPENALQFADQVPSLKQQFAADAESTSRFARLQSLTPTVIGSTVHVLFTYTTEEAMGQNTVTIATQTACDRFLETELARGLCVRHCSIERHTANDKRASARDATDVVRGVQVLAWGELTNEVCERVLKCTTKQLHDILLVMKEGHTRLCAFGNNINTANVVAAMLTASGQDAGSVPGNAWAHLTAQYDSDTQDLKVSVFFPNLPTGTDGGGTMYRFQRKSLGVLQCLGPGSKQRLAGLVASFSLALDVSAAAAIASSQFTGAQEEISREESKRSKL